MRHTFVGFGFGPIQSGLFAKEAADSGRFDEIVVAEVDGALVDALRKNNDTYTMNIAHADRVEAVTVKGVKLLNLSVPEDVSRLRTTLASATEIVTSLPSVDFYTRCSGVAVQRQAQHSSAATLIAEGLRANPDGQTIIYTAENNNHAAEILGRAVETTPSRIRATPPQEGNNSPPAEGCPKGGVVSLPMRPHQYLNTVIGKMSQVVTDPQEIARRNLSPIVPQFPRAFLVEAFNRILVSKITWPGFQPGITAFEEKDDLLPFEEAKLFGHNAIHAALGFIGKRLGVALLADLRDNANVMSIARQAFINEIGAALVKKYAHLNDQLFTQDGFTAYAEDLLERITNPFLADTVERAIRDPLRKLGANDRLFGAIRQCLAQGIMPSALAYAAAIAMDVVSRLPGHHPISLASLWKDNPPPPEEAARVILLMENCCVT